MSSVSIARFYVQAQLEGQFVAVKWIDVNQRDEQRPEYRSCLVARELKLWDPTVSGTFAATPPLECLKMVLSNFITEPADQHKSVASKVERFAPRRGQDRRRRSSG